jgi:toxin-antitoxin system PIN domain toxin
MAVALLDVNVLVALFDADHVHHELAHDWFADHGSEPWATCPTTENGFVRVLTNPAYQGPEMRPANVIALLRRFCASTSHRPWADAVSLQDAKAFDASFIRGHRQVTDVYLLGLAHHMKGHLATFDRTIPLKAVTGAKPGLIQIIEP